MKQHEFIWKVSTNTEMNAVQAVNGITECFIKNGVVLSHNYKLNNQILLIFNEYNKKYLVASDNELTEIFKIANSEDNIIQPLLDYADTNLKQI